MKDLDLLKNHKFLTAWNKDLYIADFMAQNWVVIDKLQERVMYLEGLTDGDVKLITKLQVENGELKQKLKTGSRMLDDWEKSTTHPDSTLVNIRNLKKVFTQNTEAKEG